MRKLEAPPFKLSDKVQSMSNRKKMVLQKTAAIFATVTLSIGLSSAHLPAHAESESAEPSATTESSATTELSPKSESSADAESIAKDIAVVLKSDPIKFRLAKTHQIHASEQIPQGDAERTIHVYMTISNHANPFVVSLGNFVVLRNKKGETKVLDEFGEKIPMPYAKPERVDFHKGDLQSIKAFDMITEGKYFKAVKEIDGALKLAPNSYRLHNNRGVLMAMMAKPDEAIAEFNEAIKLNASCAAAYTNRGWIEVGHGKHEAAVEDANLALKYEPKMNSARLCLVKAHLEGGNKEDAAALLEKSGLAKKNDSRSLKLHAETLISNKDYKEARLVLRKLITIAPNDADAVLQLAYVCDMVGDLDEAVGRARQAVTLAPENPGVREILGRYLEKARDNEAAAVQYEAALDMLREKPPKDHQKKALAIEGALIRTIMQMNDFKRAETWASAMTRQFPTSAKAHYNRAWLLSQGPEDYHIKEAITEYDVALKLEPSLNQTHYNLALLSIKTGDKERAESELKMFIELAPDDPDNASAKSMLAKLQATSK